MEGSFTLYFIYNSKLLKEGLFYEIHYKANHKENGDDVSDDEKNSYQKIYQDIFYSRSRKRECNIGKSIYDCFVSVDFNSSDIHHKVFDEFVSFFKNLENISTHALVLKCDYLNTTTISSNKGSRFAQKFLQSLSDKESSDSEIEKDQDQDQRPAPATTESSPIEIKETGENSNEKSTLANSLDLGPKDSKNISTQTDSN